MLDKKTKKVLNYKAMNELLDKAFDDLYGLDEYAESEKDFKQRLLPILTMFISGAERIDASAKKSDDKTQANIDYNLENIKDDAKNETVTVEVVSGEKNETSVIPEGNLNKGDFGKRKVENVKEDLNNMFGNGLTSNDSVSHK